MPQRSSAEIRASIEETRRELSYSVTDLQSKVKELTDWRTKLAQNQRNALIVVPRSPPAATVSGHFKSRAVSRG